MLRMMERSSSDYLHPTLSISLTFSLSVSLSLSVGVGVCLSLPHSPSSRHGVAISASFISEHTPS